MLVVTQSINCCACNRWLTAARSIITVKSVLIVSCRCRAKKEIIKLVTVFMPFHFLFGRLVWIL